MASIRIWYQSYVDEPHGRDYWGKLRLHLDGLVDAGTSVDIKGITPHDSYVHPLVEWRCAREMICNAVQAEREGYDAVVVGHFQDAGLYEARSAVGIPVLGLGETTMLHACTLGQRISLISLKHGYEAWVRQQISKYGLQSRVVDMHRVHVPPDLYAAAWNSKKKAEELFAILREQLRPLVQNGAEVLIPSGGGPMAMLSPMREVDGAPVLDGVAITVKMAEVAVKLKRLAGIGVSRAGGFRQAPPFVIEEFLTNPKGLGADAPDSRRSRPPAASALKRRARPGKSGR